MKLGITSFDYPWVSMNGASCTSAIRGAGLSTCIGVQPRPKSRTFKNMAFGFVFL